MSIRLRIILCGLLYLLLLWLARVELVEVDSRECFCSLAPQSHDNESVELLTCGRRQLIDTNTQLMIQCQQVNDLIRIGPVYATNQPTDNASNWLPTQTNITLADWGLAELMKDQVISRLQLSLDLTRRTIDAVAMAGLETLEELLARTNRVDWDSCALANLMQLKEVTLNCKSTFHTFLTFGSSLQTVRFVDCEGVPLQFHCVTCMQDKRIRVIRIRPGPPLNRFMVRFQNIQSYSPPKAGAHLLVGQCLTGVCSDEMMCRNNVPLLQVQHQLTKIVTPVVDKEDAPWPNSTNLEEGTNTTRGQDTDPQLDGNSTPVGETVGTRPDVRFSTGLHLSSGRYRYWVVAALLSVTLAFLVTVCVLISLTRQQRHQQNKSIFAGTARFPLLGCNGKHSSAADDEEDTLSLPDVTPGPPEVSA